MVQGDRRIADAVRLGFEREGLPTIAAADAESAAPLIDGASLVVAGGGGGTARGQLEVLAKACHGAADAPLLWVGNGVGREEALAAGADEVLPQPAYVRDVVTVGKLLAGRKRGNRGQVSGDLADVFGVFYLVRALSAMGRSGVLTLVRGLRRGELRFWEGEVTSAHMGGLHGQSGLHQLLLWTEARFEWRQESVVRRRQIPLDHDEIISQAERFLEAIHEVAGNLSPAAVYEQDVQRIQQVGKQIPTEVHGVLRMFDGNRTVADVLEDSSFRVFETLRVAQRATEVGLLRRVEVTKPKAARRAVLAVEEWLVGDTRDAVIERTMQIPDTAPAADRDGKKSKKNKKKKGRDSGRSAAIAPVTDVDWAALVPRATTVDMTAITGVVPASLASGEIEREGLEGLTADQRNAMFPGSEPSVEIALDAQRVPIPDDPGPAIMNDLSAVHVAVSAVAERERTRPPTIPPAPDLHDDSTEKEIAATRADVVAAVAHAFSEDEEAFFSAGKTLEQHHHRAPPPAESFSDLDEGYQPLSFWDRLRGRKPVKKR